VGDAKPSIGEWARGRAVRGTGCWVERELSEELQRTVREAYESGFGLVAITSYMRDVHGVTGITRSKVESYINKLGIRRG
jgi:hypothetical protein